MRGSLHAHVLVWFKRRPLPRNFSNLPAIARDPKKTAPSRQRPRDCEVVPQPGQVEEGQHYQDDNVTSHTTKSSRHRKADHVAGCVPAALLRSMGVHALMSITTRSLAGSKLKWCGLLLRALSEQGMAEKPLSVASRTKS